MGQLIRQLILVACAAMIGGLLALQSRSGAMLLAGVEPQSLVKPLPVPATPTQPITPLTMPGDLAADLDAPYQWIDEVAQGHQRLATRRLPSANSQFSADGRWIETPIRNAILAAPWDWAALQEGERTALPFVGKNIQQRFPHIAWQPRGDHAALAFLEQDASWRVWVMAQSNGARIAELTIQDQLQAMDYSPDGQWLAIAAGPRVTLYKTADYTPVAVYKHQRDEVIQIQFTADSQWLLTADADLVAQDDTLGFQGNYQLWHIADGTRHSNLLGKPARIAPDGSSSYRIVLSPDSQNVFVLPQGELRQITTQKTRLTVKLDREQPFFFAFSPNGQLLAATDATCRCIAVWAADSGKQIAQLQPQLQITTLVFAPDNQRLAIGGLRNQARHATELWDTISGKRYLDLDYGPPNFRKSPAWLAAQIKHIAWSPGGKWLLTVGMEGQCWVWDSTTGKSMLQLDYFTDLDQSTGTSELSMSFAPQGVAIIAKAYAQPTKIYYGE